MQGHVTITMLNARLHVLRRTLHSIHTSRTCSMQRSVHSSQPKVPRLAASTEGGEQPGSSPGSAACSKHY